MSKPLTKAAAKKRLSVYEDVIFNPLLAEIRARHESPRELDLLVVAALYEIHDELRRVAVELEEAR